MLNMKMIIIAIVFMAVIWFSGIVSNGNTDLQTAAVMLSGLAIIWYVTKVICCACKHREEPSCSKRQSSESL
jgi:uncharacterized protein (DUF486 family)